MNMGIPIAMKDGSTKSLADWQGHVVLVVNTASECGYTPQLETLEELFQDYAPRGLFVLAVPCNQFGEEEPGDGSDYPVTFPIVAKAEVNGPNRIPLYDFLVGDGPDIEWNFEKFLISPEGQVVGRFAPAMEPDDLPIIEAIEAHLPI